MSDKLTMTIAYDEPDEEGWIVARVLGVPRAISQGRTAEQARENVIGALRFMLAPDEDDRSRDAGRRERLELTLNE
jgi:predicted RNase H-like HicB family nuclease